MKRLLIIGLLKQNECGLQGQRGVVEYISEGLKKKEKICTDDEYIYYMVSQGSFCLHGFLNIYTIQLRSFEAIHKSREIIYL